MRYDRDKRNIDDRFRLWNTEEAIMPVYGFQFKDGPSTSFAEIVYVGWEKRTSKYDWNGLARARTNQCIFQYTLAGRGALRFGAHHYSLEPGSAFLVKTGTDHRYYLPENSPLWEFMFITLMGREALECWSFVQDQSGPVMQMPADSEVIHRLKQIYLEASKKSITNGYQAAGLAAQFLMDVYQAVKYRRTSP
jgi:hypothetical protein